MARINTTFPPVLLVALISLGAHCLVWSCGCRGEQACPGRSLLRSLCSYIPLRHWLQLRLKQALEQKYGQLVSHCILLSSTHQFVAARVVIHPLPPQWGKNPNTLCLKSKFSSYNITVSCGRYLQKINFFWPVHGTKRS